MRIGFIGAGRVANALAVALERAGETVVAVSSRRFENAERLAGRLRISEAVSHPQEVVDRADLVFLTVPDGQIRPTCDRLHWRAGTAAVHCSGAGSLDLLESARASGARVGSFHPLQTFSGGTDDAALPRSTVVGIEAGDDLLAATLRRLARAIGAEPVLLPTGEKALYHAAAVFLSNYVVTLGAAATDLLGELGIEREEGLRMLLPLLDGTVRNLRERGLPNALTGPIARGDFETVDRHLESIARHRPEVVELYQILGRHTLALAREQASIDPASGAALTDLLNERRDDAGPDGPGREEWRTCG